MYNDSANIDEHIKHRLLSSLYKLVDWMRLGSELGLLDSTLRIIDKEERGSVSNCIGRMLSAWLQWCDNVENNGLPSWRRLVESLMIVGENEIVEDVIRSAPWNR